LQGFKIAKTNLDWSSGYGFWLQLAENVEEVEEEWNRDGSMDGTLGLATE
jgi:hypothetical protein